MDRRSDAEKGTKVQHDSHVENGFILIIHVIFIDNSRISAPQLQIVFRSDINSCVWNWFLSAGFCGKHSSRHRKFRFERSFYFCMKREDVSCLCWIDQIIYWEFTCMMGSLCVVRRFFQRLWADQRCVGCAEAPWFWFRFLWLWSRCGDNWSCFMMMTFFASDLTQFAEGRGARFEWKRFARKPCSSWTLQTTVGFEHIFLRTFGRSFLVNSIMLFLDICLV